MNLIEFTLLNKLASIEDDIIKNVIEDAKRLKAEHLKNEIIQKRKKEEEDYRKKVEQRRLEEKRKEEQIKRLVEINKRKKIFYYEFRYKFGTDGGIIFADNISEANKLAEEYAKEYDDINRHYIPYKKRFLRVIELVPSEQVNPLFSYNE